MVLLSSLGRSLRNIPFIIPPGILSLFFDRLLIGDTVEIRMYSRMRVESLLEALVFITAYPSASSSITWHQVPISDTPSSLVILTLEVQFDDDFVDGQLREFHQLYPVLMPRLFSLMRY